VSTMHKQGWSKCRGTRLLHTVVIRRGSEKPECHELATNPTASTATQLSPSPTAKQLSLSRPCQPQIENERQAAVENTVDVDWWEPLGSPYQPEEPDLSADGATDEIESRRGTEEASRQGSS
jgi:hypothetical protein